MIIDNRAKPKVVAWEPVLDEPMLYSRALKTKHLLIGHHYPVLAAYRGTHSKYGWVKIRNEQGGLRIYCAANFQEVK